MGNSVIYSGNQRCVFYSPMYDAQVEYLESTGTQWIDTGIVPDSNCGVEVAIITTTETQNKSVFGCETTSTYSYKRYHITPNIGKWYFGNNNVELSGGTYNTTVGTEYVIKYNINGEVVVNNSKLADISIVNVTDISTIQIAKRGPDSRTFVNYGIYKYKYFKIYSGTTLVRDFIPVRIGSTGYMYDKVTKQLFANKGTGSFILGNDTNDAVASQRCVGYERIYEEYKWLRVTLPYGNKVYTYVPINSDNFEFTTIIESGYNLGHFATDNYWYYTSRDTNKDISIWNALDRVTENRIDVGSSTLVFESSATDFKVNGISITKYGFPATNLLYYSKGADLSKLLSAITVDGVVRYIPVRLLKDLPSTLDANNKFRPAGTCGMWDKVSNRFYGNVASSGSFSVSNN